MLNPQSGNTVRMSARIRYLSLDEVVRFVNASDEEFRKLARGPLESGARYGELCDMLIRDYSFDAGTLAGAELESGDQADFVAILATALHELGYPPSEKQLRRTNGSKSEFASSHSRK